MRLEQFLETCI